MANTVVNTRLVTGSKRIVQHVTIVSDGTEETDLVLYDSSAVATALGKTDPLMCRLNDIKYAVASATSFCHLEFDATTDVAVTSLPANASGEFCFKEIGGIKNYAGSGITGDITLTTTGLALGDSLMIQLDVEPY